jgi:hypothetical protein
VEDLPTGKVMTAEEAKFYPLAGPEPMFSEPGELPSSYGKNRLVLMPVDPYRIYAYWELTGDPPPTAGSRAVLRLHESGAATNVTRPFDVDVDLAEGKSYVHLWSAERTYRADLGLRGEDGAFVLLAQSNTITSPSAAPVPPAAPPPPVRLLEPAVRLLEPALPPSTRPLQSAPALVKQPIVLRSPVDPPRVERPPVDRPKRPEVPPQVQRRLAEIFTSNTDFSLLPAPYIEPVVHAAAKSESKPEFKPVPPSEPESDFESELEAPILFEEPPFRLADLDHLDLTQYSQERFTPGVSSEVGPLGH